ncbi:Hypothetical predicted protein [Cloeon dipterum]|uniref:Uncharacterized protein n=1 Tax=Cloeon dipterum TaxID=197152 RepID=A0A8S1DS50_9INSE|nr:Hypothetical predicted protein [Cloeon dipterum]
MVQKVPTCMVFLLFLLGFHFAFGYLVRVYGPSSVLIKACITDDHQHAVAFVKSWNPKDSNKSVEIFGLDGASNELENSTAIW